MVPSMADDEMSVYENVCHDNTTVHIINIVKEGLSAVLRRVKNPIFS